MNRENQKEPQNAHSLTRPDEGKFSRPDTDLNNSLLGLLLRDKVIPFLPVLMAVVTIILGTNNWLDLYNNANGVPRWLSVAVTVVSAIICYFALYKRGKKTFAIITFSAIVVALWVPRALGSLSDNEKANQAGRSGNEIYRVRITIVDPHNVPVVDPLGRPPDDLKVWVNVGAAPQPVPGGWQFDIPASIRPLDSKVIVRAVKENAFLAGQEELILGNDINPTVRLTLKRDDSAKVRGQVVDKKQHAIVGARVLIVGYEKEATITERGGNFELPAHAAIGQQVIVHAEKLAFQGAKRLHPAGDAPLIITLER